LIALRQDDESSRNFDTDADGVLEDDGRMVDVNTAQYEVIPNAALSFVYAR
jgi:hypothetical protein